MQSMELWNISDILEENSLLIQKSYLQNFFFKTQNKHDKICQIQKKSFLIKVCGSF